MTAVPPSADVTVCATTMSGPGPSTSPSLARMLPLTVLCGPAGFGAPSVRSSTTNLVLPIALLVPPKKSGPAVGASFTQVTVTPTVVVLEPGVNVYVNVSGAVPGGALQ